MCFMHITRMNMNMENTGFELIWNTISDLMVVVFTLNFYF